MYSFMRTFVAAGCLSLAVVPCVVVSTGVAFAQAGEDGAPAPKQITLTQKMIDGLLAAQPQMDDAQKKMTSDKPDPKTEAQMAGIVKNNGFASLDEYGAAVDTVGEVLGGIDPDTKTYVGEAALLKKQIAQLKADKSIPAKDKAEALMQMNDALKNAGSAPTPPKANIDLVVKNYDKLAPTFEKNND